jgi:hypothetical protein
VVAGEGFASSLRLRRPRNPRPPGYEKVSVFPKRTETTKSYRLTGFSGCAGWVPLVQSDSTVTPPLNELRSQNNPESSDSNGLISGYGVGGVTPESVPCRCRWCCQWKSRLRRTPREFPISEDKSPVGSRARSRKGTGATKSDTEGPRGRVQLPRLNEANSTCFSFSPSGRSGRLVLGERTTQGIKCNYLESFGLTSETRDESMGLSACQRGAVGGQITQIGYPNV